MQRGICVKQECGVAALHELHSDQVSHQANGAGDFPGPESNLPSGLDGS